jgi:hypothetical protein
MRGLDRRHHPLCRSLYEGDGLPSPAMTVFGSRLCRFAPVKPLARRPLMLHDHFVGYEMS